MNRYFTKALLVEAAKRGPEWDYNRQLAPRPIRKLPNRNFPILSVMQHRHRHGLPCEPHIRCALALPGAMAFVDVPEEFFEALPQV